MTIDPAHLDSLLELVGIGVGKAAQVLNTMLSSHVRLSVPAIKVLTVEEFRSSLANDRERSLAAVEMDFRGEISGSTQLVFASEDAGRLIDLIVADYSFAGEDLDSIRSGTLCEVGNIIINAVLGTIANVARMDLAYSVPIFLSGTFFDLLSDTKPAKDGVVVFVATQFMVESIQVDGEIVLYLSLENLAGLESAIARFANA